MAETSEAFRVQSARLKTLTTVVAALLALSLAAHPVFNITAGLQEGEEPLRLAHRIGVSLIWLTPAVLYVCALWAVRRMFHQLAREGQVFRPALAVGLRGVGWSLAWGAGMDVVGSPLLTRWLDGEPGGSVLHYSPAAAALGVVGLALVMLSRLLDRAADLQNELDQFF